MGELAFGFAAGASGVAPGFFGGTADIAPGLPQILPDLNLGLLHVFFHTTRRFPHVAGSAPQCLTHFLSRLAQVVPNLVTLPMRTTRSPQNQKQHAN